MKTAQKHQELMRQALHDLDFQTMTEWLNDYVWPQYEEMAMQALKRGDAADFGFLMMAIIKYAAARETEQDVERWVEDEGRRAAGEFRANARISQAEVNPDIRGM